MSCVLILGFKSIVGSILLLCACAVLLCVGCVPTAKNKSRGDMGPVGDAGAAMPEAGLGMGGASGQGGGQAQGGANGQGGAPVGGGDGMGGVDGMGGAMAPTLCGERDPEAQCEAAARRAGTCYSQVCPNNSLPPGTVRQSILRLCDNEDVIASICTLRGDCEALVNWLAESAEDLADFCRDDSSE